MHDDFDEFDDPDLYSATTGADSAESNSDELLQDEKLGKAAEANWAAYIRARDSGHMDWVACADRYDEFYQCEQWSSEDVAALDEENRPHLTINKVLPTINALVGEQTQRRADIQFKPKKNGEAAFALTKLSMAVDDANQVEWKETEVFTDGCITDRGYYQALINTDHNIIGDVDIKVLNPRQVLPDPTASDYDPAQWREWIYIDWVSMDEITATYGEKAAATVRDVASAEPGTYGYDSIMLESHRFGTDNPISRYQISAGDDEGKYIKKIRLIRREHKRHERIPHFLDMQSGDLRPVPNTWEPERVEAFAAKTGLTVIMRTVQQIYVTVSADRTALHHSRSPYATFSLIPYYPYFRRGKPMGVVRNIISPQEQLNKMESQELHIVNTTANSGWMVEQGSLTNMTSDDLTERGAKTGLVIEYAPDRNAPTKIQPNTVPTGIDRLAGKADAHIREISSINSSMIGEASPELSGVALRFNQSRGALQLAGPMDNLKRTRYLLARKKLELFQQFYTEERIVRYIDMTDPFNPDQELTVNQVTAAGEIVNDITLGEYEITVGIGQAQDVFEESQFAAAVEMRNAGIMIPDDVVIEASPLQRKHEIADRVREMSGMGEPTEEQMMMAKFQQEVQMQMQILDIEQKQAELAKLEAEAELARAKAYKEGNTDARLLEQLEEKIQEKREELQLRTNLAQMSNQMKMSLTEKNNEAKLLQTLISKQGK